MEHLSELMGKLTLKEKPVDDTDVIALQSLLKNMSLNANDDDDTVSELIDQMQSLEIKEDTYENGVEMEIVMKDNTVIKIFVPCYIQHRVPMETMNIINCY